jgi:hypothetical protein
MSATNCEDKYLNVTEFTSLWRIRNAQEYTSSPVFFSDSHLTSVIRSGVQVPLPAGIYQIKKGPFRVEVRDDDPSIPSPYFSLSVIQILTPGTGIQQGSPAPWYLIPTGEINCFEALTTAESDEVSIPLDSDVPVLTPCPVSSSDTSSPSSSATESREIAPWGVKFKYNSESPLLQRSPSPNSPIFPNYCSKTWSLSLLPAMQSNVRYGGGVDVPGALPGLSFRAIPAIARHKVPGFQPVYQHMGIDSVTVTMVGCFTGADGEGENVRAAFDNTNVSLLGSNSRDRRAELRKLDSYKSFQEFYRIAVQEGRELTVEINLKHSNRFEGRNSTPPTGLRNSQGNPEFKGLVKRLETYYARSDRTWYTLDIELTDYKLVSNNPINLLPDTSNTQQSRSLASESETDPSTIQGITPNLKEGDYYVWNLDVKNKVSNALGLLEDLYENQVDRVVREKLLESSPVSVSKNENDEWADGAVILDEVSCSDIQQSGLGDLILEYSVNVTLPEERNPVSRIYPCNIIRTDRVLVNQLGTPKIYVPRTNLFRPRWQEVLKAYADIVLRGVGCAGLTLAAIKSGFAAATAFLATAGTFGIAIPFTIPAGIFFSFLTITLGVAAIAECGSLIYTAVQLLRNTFGGGLEESNTRFFQTLYSEGQSKTVLGITVRLVLEIFSAKIPGLIGGLLRSVPSKVRAILGAKTPTALINASSALSTSSDSADMNAIRRIGNFLSRLIRGSTGDVLIRISDLVPNNVDLIGDLSNLNLNARQLELLEKALEEAVSKEEFLRLFNSRMSRGLPVDTVENVIRELRSANLAGLAGGGLGSAPTPTPPPTALAPTPAPPAPTPAPPTPTPPPSGPPAPRPSSNAGPTRLILGLDAPTFSQRVVDEFSTHNLQRVEVTYPSADTVSYSRSNFLGENLNAFLSRPLEPGTVIDFIYPNGTDFTRVIQLWQDSGLKHVGLGVFRVP